MLGFEFCGYFVEEFLVEGVEGLDEDLVATDVFGVDFCVEFLGRGL